MSAAAQKFFEQASALGEDQKEAAIALYDKAIKADPKYSDAYYNKGLLLNDLGKWNDAIIAIDKAIKLDPKSGLYVHGKGTVLYAMDKAQDAIAAYDKAIKLGYKDADLYYNKATALKYLGKKEEAIAALDKAIEVNPSYEEAYSDKLEILIELQRYDAGIEVADKVIELNPSEPWYYSTKADALYNLEKKNEALEVYDKCIEVNPTDPSHYSMKAHCLYECGRPEEALVLFDKALELGSEDEMIYNTKGECYTNLGRYKEAVEAYDEVIKKDKGNDWAYGNKGFALCQLGLVEEAIKCYDLQVTHYKKNWAFYAKKGKALLDLGRTKEAMEHFQEAMNEINKGTLKGKTMTIGEDATVLNDLELLLISNIKELLAIPDLDSKDDDDDTVKVGKQKLNGQKEELKIKFIGAVYSSKNNDSKQDELNALKKELEELKKSYKQLAGDVAEIKADIQDSGTKELAEVKRGFKELEEQDPELIAYCKTFYWTAINLFGAYRAASTGVLVGNVGGETNQKESLFVDGAKKVANLLAGVAEGVPIVGSALGLLDGIIDSIYGAVMANRFSNKVNAINKIIQGKLGMEDELSLSVSKVALAITRAKSQEILFPEIKPVATNKVKEGLKWLSDKIDGIKEKVLPSVKLHDENSNGAKLALQDVALLITYLCKNHEVILKRKDSLDKQMESIIKFDGLDLLFEESTIGDESKEKPQRSSCCEMF